MKTYEMIRAEINATYEELKHTEAEKKTEIDRFCKLEFDSLHERAEYMREHKEEREESLDKVAALEDRTETLKLTLPILKNNLKQVLFAEVAPIILETLQKYKGKPLGEKTREKIRNELLEKTRCSVYISNSKIDVYASLNNGHSKCDFTIYSKYVDGTERKFLIDNKVQAVTMEEVELYGKYDYVEDVKAEVTFLKEQHNKIYQLWETFKEECSKYNNRAPEGIEHINYYNPSRIYQKIF